MRQSDVLHLGPPSPPARRCALLSREQPHARSATQVDGDLSDSPHLVRASATVQSAFQVALELGVYLFDGARISLGAACRFELHQCRPALLCPTPPFFMAGLFCSFLCCFTSAVVPHKQGRASPYGRPASAPPIA